MVGRQVIIGPGPPLLRTAWVPKSEASTGRRRGAAGGM